MTESISDSTESSESVIAAGELNPQQSRFELLGNVALKIIIGVLGLMIGSALGFILALVFGFIEFAC